MACWFWLAANLTSPHLSQPLSHSCSSREQWGDNKTEINRWVSSCCHGQNRLVWGKISLLSNKIELHGENERQNLETLPVPSPLLLPRLSFTPLFLALLLPSPWAAQGHGKWGLWPVRQCQALHPVQRNCGSYPGRKWGGFFFFVKDDSGLASVCTGT